MLAVLHVELPFWLVVPERTDYQVRTYEDHGTQVAVFPPIRSETPLPPNAPDSLQIDGKPAFLADCLRIEFRRESFNRSSQAAIDPPIEVLNHAVSSFIARLRYVSRAPQVHAPVLPACRWRLRYLREDGTEFDVEPGFVRGRAASPFAFTYIVCDPVLWENLHQLAPDFQPPPWHELLVDAVGALPHIGSAVALAATALEVLIADVLQRLQPSSTIPSELWTWINDRGDWQKEPSVDEQFSTLLRVLSGHSLKERPDLWEGYRNLRSARDSFVHEGVARIGKAPVDHESARSLLQKAIEISATLRAWIPECHRWPSFEHSVQVQLHKLIIPLSEFAPPRPAGAA